MNQALENKRMSTDGLKHEEGRNNRGESSHVWEIMTNAIQNKVYVDK